MTHEQVVELILAVSTQEDIELAKAVRDKWLRHNSDDDFGVWRICEAGELLANCEWSLQELAQQGKTEERKQPTPRPKYSELEKKWERKFYRQNVKHAMHLAELRQQARRYVGWE